MSQRLVRKLCEHCKESKKADANELNIMNIESSEDITIYTARSCVKCNNSGYSGRIGLYELIVFDETAKNMINSQASEAELASYCSKVNSSLFECGIDRVLSGLTTLSEVIRVTQEV